MAGLDGIKNKIDPGPASDKDLYDLPPEELAAIPTVCGSLREALEELEKDHEFLLAGDVFTKDQLEGYMALKWEEVYMYEHTPHPSSTRCTTPAERRPRSKHTQRARLRTRPICCRNARKHGSFPSTKGPSATGCHCGGNKAKNLN